MGEDAFRLSLSSTKRALRFFGRGSHSCFQNGIARQATEREDGHIVTWDNVHGAPRALYLNEPGILPSGRRNILNACVERQDGGSRSAVLKSRERGLDESPRRQAPMEVRRTLPEREHVLPSD